MTANKLFLTFSFLFLTGLANAIEPVYEGEQGIRAQIFETNCLACHSSNLSGADRNGAPEGANFDTYDAAVDHGGIAVARAAIQMDMPPSFSDLDTLSDEQKTALQNWQALGFPEKTLPPIFSVNTGKLIAPKVYLQDEQGNITIKLHAEMKLASEQQNIAFELIEVKDVENTEIGDDSHNHEHHH